MILTVSSILFQRFPMALSLIEYKTSNSLISKHKGKVPIICRIVVLIKRMKRINVTRISDDPLVKEFSPIFITDSNVVYLLVNPIRLKKLSFNKPTHDLDAKVLFKIISFCHPTLKALILWASATCSDW